MGEDGSVGNAPGASAASGWALGGPVGVGGSTSSGGFSFSDFMEWPSFCDAVLSAASDAEVVSSVCGVLFSFVCFPELRGELAPCIPRPVASGL